MPSIEKQADISKQRIGKSFQQVHEWVDDPQHKEERHDITRIAETFQMFKEVDGEEAVPEYVQVLVDKTVAYFGAKKR